MTISIPGSTKLSRANKDKDGNDTAPLEIITGPDVYQPFMDTFWSLNLFFTKYREMNTPSNFKVADFGAGTGQVGVFIKKTYPEQMDVHLYENDPVAEQYILANAELHNVDVTTHIMDVANIVAPGQFDAVVSTPPFLPSVLRKMNWGGHHSKDPDTAIFGGLKGLDVATVFINKAAEVLKSGGLLVHVHSHPQTADTTALLENAGFENIETIRLEPMDFELEEAAFTVAYKS
jgi:release factor glutamine methyltransferase